MKPNSYTNVRNHPHGSDRKTPKKTSSTSVALGLLVVLGILAGVLALTTMTIKHLWLVDQKPEPAETVSLSCPSAEPLTMPIALPPRNFFILIDRSSSFRAYTPWAIDTLKAVLPKILSTDDRLNAAWIGNYAASPDSTFCCDRTVSRVQIPDTEPVPEMPSQQKFIELASDASSMDMVQVEAANRRIQEENEAALNAYYCAVGERNTNIEMKLSKWRQDSQVAVDTFWLESEPRFAVGRYDNSTQIREALYKASLILQQDKQREPRFLILFTDLEEVGAPGFNGVQPDLKGVQVIVVLRCENAEKCERLKMEWQNIFQSMGAAMPVTFLQNSYPEEELTQLLKRR